MLLLTISPQFQFGTHPSTTVREATPAAGAMLTRFMPTSQQSKTHSALLAQKLFSDDQDDSFNDRVHREMEDFRRRYPPPTNEAIQQEEHFKWVNSSRGCLEGSCSIRAVRVLVNTSILRVHTDKSLISKRHQTRSSGSCMMIRSSRALLSIDT